MFKKAVELHTYKNTSKPIFRKPFEKHFWEIFLSFEKVYYDIAKAISKMKASEAYANFNIFESQCPKIRILSKALNAKLSKCP